MALKQQRGGPAMGSARRSVGGVGIGSSSLPVSRSSVNVAKRGGARSGGPPRALATAGAQRTPIFSRFVYHVC